MIRRSSVALGSTLLCLTILSSSNANAAIQQNGGNEIRPVRAETRPDIDGRLDDTVWQTAPLSEPFITYNPTRGETLPQRTEVWIAYDDENLYFAFRCYDTEPDQIKTSVTQRDRMFSDDWVGISLDALGTSQTSYDLFVNPSGIQGDILTSAVSGEDMAPDFVWESAGRVTDEGYEVEMMIPLRSIRFRSGEEVDMGILFWRRISRLGTSGSWPEIEAGQSVFNMHARAIYQNLRNPSVVELLPSITYGSSAERENPTKWVSTDDSGDFGVSVKYGLTSSSTAEATFNPDFSQVESDAFQAEVNRRYPVFYQEKRPFFMEGLDIFDIAHIGHGMMQTAVHTRRIVDPQWGSKITGTVGQTAIGFLAAGDEYPGYPGIGEPNPNEGEKADFLIGRVKHSLGGDNYIGTIYSMRTFAGSGNYVAGGDAQFRFLDNHQTSLSVLHSLTTDSGNGDTNGNAVNWNYSYGSRTFAAAAAFEHYNRDFQMDSAFLVRTGLYNGWIWLSPSFYPDPERAYWLRRISPEVVYAQLYDTTTKQADHYYRIATQMFFTRQGQLRIEYALNNEHWNGRNFEETGFIMNGDVQMWRWLGFGGHVNWRDSIYYWSDPAYLGKVFSASLGFVLQPNERYSQLVEVYHEDFHRSSNDEFIYDVNIFNTRATYQFNRYFFVRAILQYNSFDKRLLTDFLASFTFIPGTVMHLGYGSIYDRRDWRNDDWVMGTGPMTEMRRGIFFKASYLWRF